MKRIFIIQNTPLNAPLPLSVYLTGLLRNIKKNKKYEINLIVAKSDNLPNEIKKLCGKIYQLDGSTYSIKDNLSFSFKVNSILKKENKKKKIDIVHCFYPNSSLLGAVMFKLFHNWKSKIVYDIRSPWIDMSIERGFINPKVVPFYRFALYAEEKFLCKFVDSFIIITKGLADFYKKKVKIKSNQKVYISPSGVDLKIFKRVKTDVRKKYGVRDDEVLIGSVGGIAKIRRLEEFLDIFLEIVQKNKKVKLMFVGEGDSLEELKRRTREFKLETNVIFVGNIPHSEVPRYMSAFDFGLCHLPNIPIYENSIPLKILEYLSCGVPVLASELKTHRELSKKLNGVIIYKKFEDITQIVNKKNIKLAKEEDFKEFNWHTIAKVYEEIWRKG